MTFYIIKDSYLTNPGWLVLMIVPILFYICFAASALFCKVIIFLPDPGASALFCKGTKRFQHCNHRMLKISQKIRLWGLEDQQLWPTMEFNQSTLCKKNVKKVQQCCVLKQYSVGPIAMPCRILSYQLWSY